ncbi:MAG: hypothetical protein KDK36_04225 [Leptospiraceae bacterium]|nr:hypothetical protein [Leptospiraceae bacterium]
MKYIILFILLLLTSSCNFDYKENIVSKLASLLNLLKPVKEREARVVIQCDADTPSGYKSLKGQVLDYDNEAAISNAFINTKVSTEVYNTDAEGKFKVQKIGTETTNIVLVVTAEKYKSFSRSMEIACQNLNVSIYLPAEQQNTSTSTDVPIGNCIFGNSIYGGCNL